MYSNLLLQAGAQAFVRHQGVALLDERFVILWTNKKFKELMQLPCGVEPVGKKVADIGSLENEREHLRAIQSVLVQGIAWHGRMQTVTPNQSVQLFGNILPLTDNAVYAKHYLFYINTDDESCRDRCYDESLEYIAFMNSHRIRQPIASMLGILDLIRLNLLDKNETEQCLLYIRKCVDDLDIYSRELAMFIHNQQ